MAARIEELENENRHLYQQIGIQADIEKAISTSLRAKIKELETAQQWHEKHNGYCSICLYTVGANEPCASCVAYSTPSKFYRRELPPMPGKGAR
jgi:hypothetical protein